MTTEDPYILIAKGVEVRFGGAYAIQNVELKIKRGTIHALIGPNGAGKSCLFNAISGGLRVSNGQIFLDKTSIQKKSIEKRQRLGIGRSFQVASVFSNMTVKENIRVAIVGRERKGINVGLPAEHYADEEIATLLNDFGLFAKRKRFAAQLSHGERQLLDIAMALATKPKLLLMDEPTQGIEKVRSLEIMERMKVLTQKKQLTILFTEHDLNIIHKFADDVTLLKAGQVVASGPTKEILTPQLVEELYN